MWNRKNRKISLLMLMYSECKSKMESRIKKKFYPQNTLLVQAVRYKIKCMLLWDNVHLWGCCEVKKNTNCILKRAIAFKELEKTSSTAKSTLKYLIRILEMGLMNLF